MLIFWLYNYLIVYTELADIVFHPSWMLLTDIRQLRSSTCLHHRPSNRIICRPEAFLRGLPQSSFSQVSGGRHDDINIPETLKACRGHWASVSGVPPPGPTGQLVSGVEADQRTSGTC